MLVLNKLLSYYSQTSALGPEGHCTSSFQRVMCILCWRQVHRRRSILCRRIVWGVKSLIFLWSS